MRVGILSHEGSWYFKELQRALLAAGHKCLLLDFGQLASRVRGNQAEYYCSEVDLLKLDAVIVRSMPAGSLEQVVWRMDLLARLEAAGVYLLNSPRALECAIDKYLTTARLQEAGLKVPATVVCENAEQACDAFESLGRDVVVKPLFGSEGRGILRVSDPDLAFRTFRTLERTDSVLYLQQFIPHAGSDIRGLVLGGELIGSMKRCVEGDYRTNVARDGAAKPYELSEIEAELCLAAAQAIGVELAGVDLLYDETTNECFVLEVNGVPGWRALEWVTGLNVAEIVVEKLSGLI